MKLLGEGMERSFRAGQSGGAIWRSCGDVQSGGAIWMNGAVRVIASGRRVRR